MDFLPKAIPIIKCPTGLTNRAFFFFWRRDESRLYKWDYFVAWA